MGQILVPICPPPIPIPGVAKDPCRGAEQIENNHSFVFYDLIKMLKLTEIYPEMVKTILNSPVAQLKQL